MVITTKHLFLHLLPMMSRPLTLLSPTVRSVSPPTFLRTLRNLLPRSNLNCHPPLISPFGLCVDFKIALTDYLSALIVALLFQRTTPWPNTWLICLEMHTIISLSSYCTRYRFLTWRTKKLRLLLVQKIP